MENRFDFKNLFESLRNNSDELFNNKIANLDEKDKMYIERYIFDYDMKSICSYKNRFLKVNLIAENIKKYFEERNKLIERLTSISRFSSVETL